MSIMYPDTVGFRLLTEKDTLSHGEATPVRAIAVSSDGGEVQIDSTTMIRYTMVPDTLGSFISAAPETSNTVNARYADARAGRIKFVANKSKPDSIRPVLINVVQISDTTKRGSKTVCVNPLQEFGILLGETKYFRTRNHPTQTDKLIIEVSEEPELDGAIAEDVWGDNPVAIATGDGQGRRMGAYWEKEKPILGHTNTTLPRGLIRLIGRYWHPDSVYKVILTAYHAGRTGRAQIEIKKPARLGDSHAAVTDVFGTTNTNLDSIVIRFAGDYGIPPQIIKGQIQKESSQFTPAWRYEPFKDKGLQENRVTTTRYFDESLPFVADETTMGSGDLPSGHTNEDPHPYVSAPTKISTFVVQYWQRYVQHHTGDESDIIVGSSSLTGHWDELYRNIQKDKRKKLTDAQTRQQAHDKLKAEIQDQTSAIGRPFDVIAQTRKVTSYGLTQMMYTTAADNVFDNDHRACESPSAIRYVDQNDEHTFPEKLNEQVFLMPRYCDFLWKKLNHRFSTCIPDGNWTTGFEAKWENALVRYNGASDYGAAVLANAQNFLPTE